MKFQVIVILLLSSISCFSQMKWNPYVGLHISMDAEGYYVGASAEAGINFQFKKKMALSGYLHYFPRRVDYSYDDGTFESGIYRSGIFGLLLERNFFKRKNKGVILGGGFAIQHTFEDYTSSWYYDHVERTILVAAARIGYVFPAGKKSISIELNAVGPHITKFDTPPYESTMIEILTQLSFGIRLIF